MIQENTFTEKLAGMLKFIPGLATEYCSFLLSRVSKPAFTVSADALIDVQTQVDFGNGRLDLVLKAGKNGLICEHKVWSSLGVHQIERYRGYADSRRSFGEYYHILLIGPDLNTSEDAKWADGILTWSDVNTFLMRDLHRYKEADQRLLEEFELLLNQEGLLRATYDYQTPGPQVRQRGIRVVRPLPEPKEKYLPDGSRIAKLSVNGRSRKVDIAILKEGDEIRAMFKPYGIDPFTRVAHLKRLEEDVAPEADLRLTPYHRACVVGIERGISFADAIQIVIPVVQEQLQEAEKMRLARRLRDH